MNEKEKIGSRSLAVRDWQERDCLSFVACVGLAENFGRERAFEVGFAELRVGARLTTGRSDTCWMRTLGSPSNEELACVK